jgi:cellulose 1,4-beta-cellobiosidase
MLVNNPTWNIEATGTGSCSLTATTNVQGRVINGISDASACGTAATQYTNTFIHIEQDPNMRNPSNWIQSILDVWIASPPAAPTLLTATPGSGSVTLSWPAPSGASSYAVFRSTTSGGPYTQIATTTSTTYTDTGLTNGVTYYYVVQAINQFGNGGISPQASVTPQAGPGAPTGVTATAGRRQVAVSWTAVSGATSYKLKRSTTNGGPYTVVASGITGTSVTNTGLTAGTTYYFVVSAVSAAGIESPNSVQVSAVPTSH